MFSNDKPATGKILISEPFMPDPNFKRSVVLLTEHGAGGSVGFVLNQKSGFLLSDLMEEFEGFEYQVFTGGPVGNDSLHFLHTLGDQITGGVEVSEGVFWGGNFESLRILCINKMISEDQIKFFVGYSGWGEGQLENEINQNSWIVTSAKVKFIFSDDDKQLWAETVKSLGSKYAIMVNFPENPNLN